MPMSDRSASYIRTMWPLFLGHLAALLVAFAADRFGVHLNDALAFEFVGFAASALVYLLGRKLENSRVTVLRGAGHFILSLGLATTQPTYNNNSTPKTPKTPRTTARR